MTDRVSLEQRSRMMAAARGLDTLPELYVRKKLFAAGFRYRLHATELAGKPDPSLGGGLRSTVDMLENYLRSKDHCNLKLLIEYADRLGNRAVFKRLGFLLERHAPGQKDAIAKCSRRLSKGYAKLDPSLPPQRLVTAWALWVPAGW